METDYCEYEANHDPFLEEKAMNVLTILRKQIEKDNIKISDLMVQYDNNNQGGLTIDQFREMVG